MRQAVPAAPQAHDLLTGTAVSTYAPDQSLGVTERYPGQSLADDDHQQTGPSGTCLRKKLAGFPPPSPWYPQNELTLKMTTEVGGGGLLVI